MEGKNGKKSGKKIASAFGRKLMDGVLLCTRFSDVEGARQGGREEGSIPLQVSRELMLEPKFPDHLLTKRLNKRCRDRLGLKETRGRGKTRRIDRVYAKSRVKPVAVDRT